MHCVRHCFTLSHSYNLCCRLLWVVRLEEKLWRHTRVPDPPAASLRGKRSRGGHTLSLMQLSKRIHTGNEQHTGTSCSPTLLISFCQDLISWTVHLSSEVNITSLRHAQCMSWQNLRRQMSQSVSGRTGSGAVNVQMRSDSGAGLAVSNFLLSHCSGIGFHCSLA